MALRPALLALVGALALAAPPPGANADAPSPYLPSVSLLSRTPAGGVPNGPSRNPVISHDRRIASVAAYESTAFDIAPGALPGVSNVYAVPRAEPWGEDGTEWRAGPTILASHAFDGSPADGPSYEPALDGDSRTAPRCLAFLSAATNLVPGDTNGQPDAFVYHLITDEIQRVSVGSHGEQADGPTIGVSIDGRCKRVAFVSRASNLALTGTGRGAWRSAVTAPAPPGPAQIYVRAIGGESQLDHALRGLTFLASATRGVPGNSDSAQPVLSANGRFLAFASLASNLGGAPESDVAQIYRLSLRRHYGVRRHGHTLQDLRLATRLVSAGNGPGDGPSFDPAIDAGGSRVAYSTLATNLLSGATHGVSQVIKTELAGGGVTHRWVSARNGRLGTSASGNASLTAGGEWVFYESAAPELRPPGDANPGRDVVLNGFGWVQSQDPGGRFGAGDSTRPRTSPHGNYVVFGSSSLAAVRGASSAPQAFLAYLGPK